MKKTIISALVIFSGLFLSACDLTDQVKTELPDGVGQTQEITNNKIDNVVQDEKVEDMTDEELLKDLSSPEPDLDDDFTDLEAELSQ